MATPLKTFQISVLPVFSGFEIPEHTHDALTRSLVKRDGTAGCNPLVVLRQVQKVSGRRHRLPRFVYGSKTPLP